MIWAQPHISKIYEALGAIGDGRIEIQEGKNEARMSSSSGNKFYSITWNDDFTQMMANDNSAYWGSKLSYPMIAVLMIKGKLIYNPKVAQILKGIKWKDLNTKFQRKYDKMIEFVLEELTERGKDVEFLKHEVSNIKTQLATMTIEYFGSKVKPPAGY